MASWPRAHDRLRQLQLGIVRTLGKLTERAALANGLIDGRAGTSAHAAQRETNRTKRIEHGTTTRTTGAARHSQLVAQPAIGANGRAIEPGLLKVLATLHVESDSDGVWFTLRVGRRTAAVASTEICGEAIARDGEPAIMAIVVAVVITIAVTIPVVIGVAILVAVLIAILLSISGHGQRANRDGEKNCEDGHDTRRSALLIRIAGLNPLLNLCHCTPP